MVVPIPSSGARVWSASTDAMSTVAEQPRKRAAFGPASLGVGLLGIIVVCTLVDRSGGEVVSGRMLLFSAMVLVCSLLAGASGLYALGRRETGRACAFIGLYFSLAGVLYVIRELLV